MAKIEDRVKTDFGLKSFPILQSHVLFPKKKSDVRIFVATGTFFKFWIGAGPLCENRGAGGVEVRSRDLFATSAAAAAAAALLAPSLTNPAFGDKSDKFCR